VDKKMKLNKYTFTTRIGYEESGLKVIKVRKASSFGKVLEAFCDAELIKEEPINDSDIDKS